MKKLTEYIPPALPTVQGEQKSFAGSTLVEKSEATAPRISQYELGSPGFAAGKMQMATYLEWLKTTILVPRQFDMQTQQQQVENGKAIILHDQTDDILQAVISTYADRISFESFCKFVQTIPHGRCEAKDEEGIKMQFPYPDFYGRLDMQTILNCLQIYISAEALVRYRLHHQKIAKVEAVLPQTLMNAYKCHKGQPQAELTKNGMYPLLQFKDAADAKIWLQKTIDWAFAQTPHLEAALKHCQKFLLWEGSPWVVEDFTWNGVTYPKPKQND